MVHALLPIEEYPLIQLINIWTHSSQYSPKTLRDYRNHLRSIAHDPKTGLEVRFLYRMLRGRIEDRKGEINAHWHQQLKHSAATWQLQSPMRYHALTVIPLMAKTKKEKRKQPVKGILKKNVRDVEELLPVLFPYPKGTQGMALFMGSMLCGLRWFKRAGAMETHWFPTILPYARIRYEDDLRTKKCTRKQADEIIKKVMSQLLVDFENDPVEENEIKLESLNHTATLELKKQAIKQVAILAKRR